MSKSRIVLLLLIFCFMACTIFGTAFASWTYTGDTSFDSSIIASVPDWTFEFDTDFALFENLGSFTNLTAERETTLTRNSFEAIRLTSTTGTSTKDHTFNIYFDRTYTVREIRFYKIEFDYYHRYKREQYTKGIPTLQFINNNSTYGSTQGGLDSVEEFSPVVVTDIDENWWHLEYYVFAHIPTLADHGDSALDLNKKVNGIRINDRYVYDYKGTTAFMVIDNLRLSEEPAARLGNFNRWASFASGSYFWFKVAFSGELHSCVITTSDPEIAVWDAESTKSPFYVKGLKAGRVTLTATLELGPRHEIYTISRTFDVT